MLSEANQDVLERMRAQGDRLEVARGVDFTVIFPDERSARMFAEEFFVDYRVTIEKSEADAERPWDVVLTRRMVPSNEEITAFEQMLEAKAAALGGKNDGWGCFAQ